MSVAERKIMKCRVVKVNGVETIILPKGTTFTVKEKGKRAAWFRGHATDDYTFPLVTLETNNNGSGYRSHFIDGINADGNRRRYELKTKAQRLNVHKQDTEEEVVDYSVDLEAKPIGKFLDILRGKRRVEEATPEDHEELKRYNYASKF